MSVTASDKRRQFLRKGDVEMSKKLTEYGVRGTDSNNYEFIPV